LRLTVLVGTPKATFRWVLPVRPGEQWLKRTIYANVSRLDKQRVRVHWERIDMRKCTSLAAVFLILAISTASQTSKQHFNLGMTIDEFATKFDLARRDERKAHSMDAARSAMRGERSTIQTNLGGTKMAFLFDNYTLREVEITAGNTFEHELQALTEPLGEPNVSKFNLAVWDRSDGTRFTLTSRQGTGVLVVAPTPLQSN